VARCFRQGTGVAADNWTAAGLRFNDWPAETFKARRIQQRDSAIIKRLEQFGRSVGHLRYAVGNSETFRQGKKFGREHVTNKNGARVPFAFAERENPKRPVSILSAQIGADVQNKWNIQIEVWNLRETRRDVSFRQFAKRIIQAEPDQFNFGRSGARGNEATCVRFGGLRNAGHDTGAA